MSNLANAKFSPLFSPLWPGSLKTIAFEVDATIEEMWQRRREKRKETRARDYELTLEKVNRNCRTDGGRVGGGDDRWDRNCTSRPGRVG